MRRHLFMKLLPDTRRELLREQLSTRINDNSIIETIMSNINVDVQYKIMTADSYDKFRNKLSRMDNYKIIYPPDGTLVSNTIVVVGVKTSSDRTNVYTQLLIYILGDDELENKRELFDNIPKNSNTI